MTGTRKLCMLINGVVKRFLTAVVNINAPYYKGSVKALRMENPIQELIVENIPGASGVESCYENKMISNDKCDEEMKFHK